MLYKIEVYSRIFVSVVVFIIAIIIGDAIIKFNNNKDDLEMMNNVISKALIQCYALEGSFPNDLDYLTNYGVIFDEDKYLYLYEPFGDKIPTVKIIELDNDFRELGGVSFE